MQKALLLLYIYFLYNNTIPSTYGTGTYHVAFLVVCLANCFSILLWNCEWSLCQGSCSCFVEHYFEFIYYIYIYMYNCIYVRAFPTNSPPCSIFMLFCVSSVYLLCIFLSEVRAVPAKCLPCSIFMLFCVSLLQKSGLFQPSVYVYHALIVICVHLSQKSGLFQPSLYHALYLCYSVYICYRSPGCSSQVSTMHLLLSSLSSSAGVYSCHRLLRWAS